MSANLQYFECSGVVQEEPTLAYTPRDQKPVLNVHLELPAKSSRYVSNEVILVFFGDEAMQRKERYSQGDTVFAAGLLRYYNGKKQIMCNVDRKIPSLTIPINTIRIMGHIVKDAEPFPFGNDNILVKFSIAHNFQNKADFHDCVIFGRRGEKMLPNLTKGQWISLSGELLARTTTSPKQGEKTSEEIVVNEIQFDSNKYVQQD